MRHLVAVIATITAFGLTVSFPLFGDQPGSQDQVSDQVDILKVNPDMKSTELTQNMKSLDLEELHHQVDLNGMLEKINENNSKLGEANVSILGNLQSINDKATLTGNVSDKLGFVHDGLGGQNATLDDLNRVTGQQVGLSTDLNNLSQFLHGKMNRIIASAHSQVSLVRQLRAITLDTKAKMKMTLNQNRQVEQKLRSASAKSKKAEQSMP